MSNPLRSIAAVVIGVITFVVVVGVSEMIGHRVFGVPADLDPNDPESIKAAMQKLPKGALVAVVASWALGALVGSWTAARLAPSRKLALGLVIGMVGLLATIANLLMIPHPTWMWVIGVAEILPAAYLGARIATWRRPANE